MHFRFPYGLILWGLAIIIFTACSSTSTDARYNKPSDNESNESSSSVRFTSKENKKDESEESFNNIEEPTPEFDEIPVEEYPVDTEEFVGKYGRIESLSAALTTREKILFEIITYLDTPYLYGGISKNGIDCSAFTQQVFNNSVGVQLPRTASLQYQEGEEIETRENLIFGDLLFFNTTSRSYPGHVGIYLGENLFAHASRSLGVTVSSLKSSYYQTRYIGAKRIK